MPCGGCSRQHFVKGSGQVVVVVAGSHQLAEGEAIQLTEPAQCCGVRSTFLARQRCGSHREAPFAARAHRQPAGDLRRCHPPCPRDGSQMPPHLVERIGVVWPVDKGLALRCERESQWLSFNFTPISPACGARRGNAAPTADEVLFEGKTMAGGMTAAGHQPSVERCQ